MAVVRVLVSFSFLCLTLHFLVNQAEASSKVKTLNYPVRNKRSRNRQAYFSPGCNQKTIIDEVHGFLQLDDYNVQSVVNTGLKVTWKAPQGINNSSLDGYRLTWFVDRDQGSDDDFGKSSVGCIFLSAENTSFVVYESSHWKKKEEIKFAINPLPVKSSEILFGNSFKFKELTTPKAQVSTLKRILISPTESTNSDIKTSQSSTKSRTNFSAASPSSLRPGNVDAASADIKQNKEKEIFTFVSISIACIAILILGVILAKRWKSKLPNQKVNVELQDPGYIYVSYLSESKGHTDNVVDFSSWLRKHGYNVQMDIMLSPSNQNDLKELGRQRWGVKQISQAKNVFIILSPSYLNLCRLDEGKTDASSLTQEEKIIYNEITQIRNELSSEAYITSRFIPVLFGVKETELPFWIKQLVVYNWPKDKMNNKLLYRINEELFAC